MAIQNASRHSRRRHRRSGSAAGRVIPAATAFGVLLLLGGGCGGGSGGSALGAASTGSGNAPTDGSAARGTARASKIPEATTFTTVSGAPKDPGPSSDGTPGGDGMPGDGTPGGGRGGLVLHPDSATPIFDRPGGRPVATLPARQLGGPTWVPVVESSGAWRRVLLPSKPNRSSGWISGDGLRAAYTPYTVRIDLAKRRLTLLKSARKAGQWTVATGGPKTPTPQGRTFLMATLAPAKKTPSPLVLPLGAHSATLDTFGGGPGTVALHGWPDTSVFGKAVTHGCVRVPKDALRALSRVPLGSLVIITA
ncbi:L,D-transpeptidase [Actinomadura sp. 9N215]|uniref:L,D-transpeptidase n=1 Tax=Actinomadura sp. 9N215 TaxID=3375150 RepID=UPI0037919C72